MWGREINSRKCVKNVETDFSVFSVIFLRFSVFFGFSNTDVGFGFGFG